MGMGPFEKFGGSFCYDSSLAETATELNPQLGYDEYIVRN